MAAKYTDYEVSGEIYPLTNGTRVRAKPSTYSNVLTSYPAGSKVKIDLVREYQETVAAEYCKAGDKWGRVVSINGAPPNPSGECWMAIVYLGNQICTEDYVFNPSPDEIPTTKDIVGATIVLKYADNTESDPINMVVDNG